MPSEGPVRDLSERQRRHLETSLCPTNAVPYPALLSKELPLLGPLPAIFGLLLYGTDPCRYELEGHLHIYETPPYLSVSTKQVWKIASVMLGLGVAAGGTQMS